MRFGVLGILASNTFNKFRLSNACGISLNNSRSLSPYNNGSAENNIGLILLLLYLCL